MVNTIGLFVRLVAQPGREAEVESFLKTAVPLVQAEPATTAWFAIRMGPSTFAIFDVFPGEDGREAHLQGAVPDALMQKAPELLAETPVMEKLAELSSFRAFDVLAEKLPAEAPEPAD